MDSLMGAPYNDVGNGRAFGDDKWKFFFLVLSSPLNVDYWGRIFGK